MKKIMIILILTVFIWTGSVLAGQLGEIDIHGFVSQGYLKSDENNFLADTQDGTYEFNEVGLNFGTWPTADLHLGLQLFARDMGDIGNDEIVLDWAFADYHYQKWLGLRLCKMKSPMGLYNETRDMDMLRVNILLPQGIYNEGWRDSVQATKGLGIYGSISAGVMGEVSYDAQVGIMDIPSDGGIAKFINGQAALSVSGFDDIDTSYVASLRWEPHLDGLRIGATGRWFDFVTLATTTDNQFWRNASVGVFSSYIPSFGMTVAEFEALSGFPLSYDSIAWAAANIDPTLAYTSVVGASLELPVENFYYMFSLEYIWEDLTFAAEYGINEFEYETILGGSVVQSGEVEIEGWYVSTAYRFNEWYEMGIYYSYFTPDTNDRDGDGMNSSYGYPKGIQWSKDWCLSMRFDVNEYWIVKFEAHMIDGLAVMYIEDQELNADGSYDVDDEWSMFAVKVTYTF